MNGELLALGVSFKTAPVEPREQLALTEGRATAVLAELTAYASIHEAVALSTCNRTELYLVTMDSEEAVQDALAVLADVADTIPEEVARTAYVRYGIEVARHLFSVTASLDSMIVGEAEIQGQVKRAFELALVEGSAGPLSSRLFRDALAAGKRVRTETGVGRSHVSIATVAADVACRNLGAASARVLVIGAGEQGESVARALHERGTHAVFVANRRYERALELADRYDGSAIPLDELPAELSRADVVVSCTSSPHQLVGREELAVVREAAPRPLVIIDMAVPRDVDPAVRDMRGVTLYDMDDLEDEVVLNVSQREAEAERARELVDEEVERFGDWIATLDVLPTVRGLRERANAIVEQVLTENDSRWQSLSDADHERLRTMCRALVARLFHEPTLRLREGADDEFSYLHIAVVRELFGLDRPQEPLAPDDAPIAEVTQLDSHRRQRG